MTSFTHYILDGTKVVAQYQTSTSSITPSNVIYFYYDESGSPTGLKYNGNIYFFQKNLQGDIIRILNTQGSIVATYTYDAWGNIISSTDTSGVSIGTKNPFRYRGYYYDTETGLYYLNSRYYDPQVGRFLNADGLVSTGQGLLGSNMFAYCENNPIIGYDPTGAINWKGFWTGVAITAIGIGIIASAIATGGTSLVAWGTAFATGTLFTGSGMLITYGASTEEPIVFDVSATDGNTNDKVGYSVVLDFDCDSLGIDVYSHYGKTNASTGANVAGGIVSNYTGSGSYGGEFIDFSYSRQYYGIDYGLEYCQSPTLGPNTCCAMLYTMGVNIPSPYLVVKGIDYYNHIGYWELDLK